MSEGESRLPDDMPRFMRLDEVVEATGMSKVQLYSLERDGLFPKRRKIGKRAVAWFAHEIREWMESRPLADEMADDEPAEAAD